MCGIAGVIQYESKVPREMRHRALRILFSEIMLKTEPRGKDATGVYQVHSDGDWLMTKKGQKVSEWITTTRADAKCEDPIVYPELVETWLEHPMELKALVGHCRAATVGSKGKDNNDNHPFAVQLDEKNAILGIHNGTLNNHEKIFEKLPDFLPRHGSVDSESLFHFLYHLTDKGTKPVDGDMLKYMGERVEGAAAVIMVNTRFPEQVVTFRKDRPMEYYMIAPLNIVVIASEKPFVEAAIEKYNFLRNFIPEYEDLPELEHGHRILVGENYRIFDSSLEWPTGRPIHNDFDKVSDDEGVMWKGKCDILEDWQGPKKFTNTTTSTSSTTKTTAGGNTVAKVTKKTTPTTVTASAKKGDDDDAGALVDAKVVEVEIGTDKEVKKAMEHVAALGLIVNYDTPKALADSLGVTVSDVGEMSGLVLANKLSELHFGLGHAAAMLHSKNDIAEVRRKAASKDTKMEKLAEKQKLAQDHIWEHRQLVTIVCALHKGGYRMSLNNVKVALSAFPSLEGHRKEAILKAAEQLLENGDTQSLIDELVEGFRKAEPKKKVATTS
jgi:glucosamine 6-phosphate synthetase-like amidotransferase/phosphosugar isomerase protein